ncbi:MAG: N-acetyltransferase [Mariprofundaceae bacterium]|nr:N-acetyltransferase [Mariprofundaceae bacterium]
MKAEHIQLRAAQVQDVEAMYQLMLPLMQDKTLIQRDKDDLYQHVQEFVVAIVDEQLLGVAALHVYASNLAEIRSLVVAPHAQGWGLGLLLVQNCEDFARQVGVSTVFALTYVDTFFIKQGYRVVSKESLPQKVWTVCIHCPKFSFCDEIAVQKDLVS